ncbi:hypothetical protein J3E68DRAFT_167742 [Trichoderma sp. SZMC 28012]
MAVRRAWGQPKPPQHLNLARRDSAKSHKPSRSLPFCLSTRTRIHDAVPLPGAENRLSELLQRRGSQTRTGLGVCFSSNRCSSNSRSLRPAIPFRPRERLFRLVTHGRLQRSCLSCIDIGEGRRVTWD